MMARYIDADALMRELEREVELADDWKTAHEIVNVVKYFPTTESEPKHAHWIADYNNTYSRCRMKCSACRKFSGIGGIKSNQKKPYCPNCGAKMDME